MMKLKLMWSHWRHERGREQAARGTLEHASLITLALAVGAAHFMIAPPLWLGLLVGLPVGLALGMAHAKLWAWIRRRAR